MNKESERNDPLNQSEHRLHQVRLPGFITGEEIGLGDMIKNATSYFGIKPCGGCKHRTETLNRWMVFTSKRQG